MAASSAAYAVALMAAGNLLAHYRRGHSLKTNVLGWLAEKMQLFPMVPPTEDECEASVAWHRARWALVSSASSRLPTFPSIHATQDFAVPSRDASRSIPVRFYRPCRADESEVLPLLVFLHGGGWVFGSLDAYDGVCRNLANKIGIVVCSVEYRLAPEHRFPCGLEDAVDVIQWARTCTVLGCDAATRGLGVCGDSAGGNLAAAAAQLVKHDVALRVQVLIYPATCAFAMPLWRDPPTPHYKDSMVQQARGIALTAAVFPWFWTLYLGDPKLAWDERASPVLAKDFSALPPAVIVTAQGDPLLDEGREYGAILRRHGVHVDFLHYADAHHGFLMLEQAAHFDEAFDAVAVAVRRAFASAAKL